MQRTIQVQKGTHLIIPHERLTTSQDEVDVASTSTPISLHANQEEHTTGNDPKPSSVSERTQRTAAIVVLVIALIAVATLLVALRLEDTHVKVLAQSGYSAGSAASARYQLEERNARPDGSMEVKGWFVLPGVTYPYYNYGNDEHKTGAYDYMRFAVKNDDGSLTVFPTKLELRPDVTAALADGTDYRYCGFHALVPAKWSSSLDSNQLVMAITNPDGDVTVYPLSWKGDTK